METTETEESAESGDSCKQLRAETVVSSRERDSSRERRTQRVQQRNSSAAARQQNIGSSPLAPPSFLKFVAHNAS